MTLPDKLEDRLELIEAVWKKYWKENALEKGKLGKASAFAVTGNTILGKEEPQQPQGEETPTLFCWLCYLEKNNRLPPGLELLDLPHQCEKDAKLPVQPQGFIYSGGYSSFKRHLWKDHCRESITICPDTFVSQAAVKTTDRTVFEDYAQFFLKRGIDPTSVPSFTPKKRRSLSEYGVESDANRDGFETPSSLSKKRRVDEGTVVEPISGPLEYYCLELLRYEGFAINTFESPVFREFVRALNPDISLPSRSRLKALLHADYKRPTSRSSMPAPETPSSAVKATSVTTVDPVSSNTGAPSGIPLSAPLDVAQTAESVYSSVALPVTSSSLPTAELVVAPNVSTSSSLPLVPSSS
mmetsp:Transcript_29635/g.76570  ORF Transcript_29635/g.76570 Transcript_29635/m.76570 type:complete len:354 (-) Transcript_29635:142-1203(-)|eukprot:CAMPEP_0113869362 /NCGR_PEP_ID=MMETSP0780_2-20120614/1495_1 /TAXON_ID=652834 /ORGANISM="Palpitomonas bilix" /LENGTH=353 /DNA_ID=CAMNT_0000854533 /DNA_START=43 /DNA_END=1104 /DNA_ORIENTATION=- /assembly_acc=CAM_ASM_000599